MPRRGRLANLFESRGESDMTSHDKPTKRTATQGNVLATLPAAMTGRASPAKAALGDKPVFAYISSLPQPQRSIAERVDALAAETLPGLQRSVKWGMAWYGVGDGWCFSCGGFAGHVKAHFRARHRTHARTASCADRDGQGLARRRPRISGRPRRTSTRVVDETGHGYPRFRGEEAVSPASPVARAQASASGASIRSSSAIVVAQLRIVIDL